jgi:hypothetical protein
MFMEGHFVSSIGESVDTVASSYDYCSVSVCGLGLCKFRIEMGTKHCHLSAIHDDTQDHLSFKCMLHTLHLTLNMLELSSFEMSGTAT